MYLKAEAGVLRPTAGSAATTAGVRFVQAEIDAWLEEQLRGWLPGRGTAKGSAACVGLGA